jgi:predicted alpha-1,2-mannosidase
MVLLIVSCQNNDINLRDYVNPNIGTAHSRWFFYTPAALPFGMAKPAPSTNGHYGNKWGWEAVGYDERHTSIEGFVNVHEFQLGGISLMPICGDLKTVPGKLEDPDSGYRSRFNKSTEVAKPGYYKVELDDYNIQVELTSSKRVAFHRYTFPENSEAHIIFDIGRRQGESGAVIDAKVYKKDDNCIEGWVRTLPEYVKKYQKGAYVDMYFSAQLNQSINHFGVFRNDSIMSDKNSIDGIGAGAYVTFDTHEAKQVEVQVGLSYTSIENARKNLLAETVSFDEAHKTAARVWNEELGKIAVSGGDEHDKVKFYTGLYHALLGRGLASDVNGAYPRNDGSIGQIPLDKVDKPQFDFYNTDAVWGAFWNLTQLWTLAWPDYYNDFVQSHLLVYKDAGWLGDGLANSRYVSGVGTNYVGLIIASAYNCGIRNYDVDIAFEAALKNELEWKDRPLGAGKLDVRAFVENGTITHTDNHGEIAEATMFSASHVLEYSFSASAVANMAASLGKEKEFNQLHSLSKAWQTLFNDQNGFIHPIDSLGNFIDDFNPFQAWRGFQEGNAWQYSFYVPHDCSSLVRRIGNDRFIQRLDSVFLSSRAMGFGGGKEIDAFAGVETLYNHGNQPSLHIPWLYTCAGAPEKTQFWTRTICNEFYGNDPIHGYGYGQDEDQGQLGAWYVMASIGLFDVAGLTGENPYMQIGSPAFDEIKISLNPEYYSGKFITIRSYNNNAGNLLIESLSINGESTNERSISFHELMKGATIEINKKSSKYLYNDKK